MKSPDRDEFFIQLRVPCRRSINGMMTGELFAPAFGFSVNQNDDLIGGLRTFLLSKAPPWNFEPQLAW